MNKIPFDIKYRPEIEAGKYKVVTGNDEQVRIVCWDADELFPIVAVVRRSSRMFRTDGRSATGVDCLNLFLVPVEPELTEFEKALSEFAGYAISGGQVEPNMPTAEFVKGFSAKLLEAARKELQPEIDAEVGKAYKNADKIQFKRGREEAMKGMPRWRKCVKGELIGRSLFYDAIGGLLIQPLDHRGFSPGSGFCITLDELTKLPKEK